MKLIPSLTPDLTKWAQRQPVFFTGSAPTHAPHVNVSPKGLSDSHFAIIDPNTCAYIDRTGSGCETISHAYENSRLCLMFMSFGDLPRILRLFCKATVIEWDHPKFNDWVRKVSKGQRDAFDGARAVIVCDIWQVQTSCGFGVPRVKKAIYAPDADEEVSTPDVQSVLALGQDVGKLTELSVFETRPTLESMAKNQAQSGKTFHYQKQHNAASLDGLPGLRSARRDSGQWVLLADLQAWANRVGAERGALALGLLLGLLLFPVLQSLF